MIDLEGKWGMRIESALAVRKVKVGQKNETFFGSWFIIYGFFFFLR